MTGCNNSAFAYEEEVQLVSRRTDAVGEEQGIPLQPRHLAGRILKTGTRSRHCEKYRVYMLIDDGEGQVCDALAAQLEELVPRVLGKLGQDCRRAEPRHVWWGNDFG